MSQPVVGAIDIQEAKKSRRLAVAAWRVCLVTLSLVLAFAIARGSLGFDFNGDFYLAGSRIMHGTSPYEPQLLSAQARLVGDGGAFHKDAFPRYPAPVLVAAAPLSLLPVKVADVVFIGLSLLAVVVAVRLLDVRDWRCIALACLSWPAVFGVGFGNVSPLLFLGGAAAWRWRDRVWPSAAVVASIVVAKLFMWPLAVWMLITRRFRALAATILIAILVTVAGWAVIGFAGLTDYPHMLLDIASIGEGRGCSLVAALISVGAPVELARATALLVAAALFGLAWRLSRMPDGDRRSFGLIVIAALTACPVVWAHYLILLYIPIALLTPSFSGLWFLPMVAGVIPEPVAHPHIWVSVPDLAVEVVLAWKLCEPLIARSALANRIHLGPTPESSSA